MSCGQDESCLTGCYDARKGQLERVIRETKNHFTTTFSLNDYAHLARHCKKDKSDICCPKKVSNEANVTVYIQKIMSLFCRYFFYDLQIL